MKRLNITFGTVLLVLGCFGLSSTVQAAGRHSIVALFPDGRIVMRDMKVAGKDKLQQTQHAFARIARRLFPGRIEFGVVEWGRVRKTRENT